MLYNYVPVKTGRMREDMDLWDIFERELLGSGVSAGQMRLGSGDRHNYSFKMVHDRCVLLPPNNYIMSRYSDGARYICVKDMTFDILLTIYDVNTCATAALRISQELPESMRSELTKFLKKLSRPRLELRAIGLQDGYPGLLPFIEAVHKLSKAALVEADLFGTNIRHIVIDTRTGMPYNLLLSNTIYRPGELLNKGKFEDFGK